MRGMGSEQVASVLRQSGAHVRLIVARCMAEPAPTTHPYAPIVPTHQVDDHLHNLHAMLVAMENATSSGSNQIEQLQLVTACSGTAYLAQLQQVSVISLLF